MTITIADGRGALWQWDTGRRLRVGSGVEQIHYQNRALGCSVDVDVGADGTAIIPDELLQDCHTLTAYVYVTDDTGAYTMEQQDFIVHKRAKPAGYVYTPTDQMTLQTIQRQIGDLADLTTEAKDTLVAAINEVASAGDAGSMALRVADGYIQYSTDSGSTWQNLIAMAELKGDKGDPGAPGKDGHSPVVTATKSGKTTTISVDGAAIATVEDGADGKPGTAGADGSTPTVGANGNWYLGEEDTGKPSRGAIGAPGKDGNPGAPGKDGAGMDITGATVGQIAKITAVDASGVPTAWSPADMPSGGSSDAVLYTAQELTYGQKFQARKNIGAAASEVPTITGGVSLCPANVTDSNTAVHTTTTTAGGDDFTLTLDGGPENALVRVKGIRTPTDADTNAAATVEYVKAKVASGGITPHIGDNGNWYLGEEDTGKPSRGAKGDPGAPGKDGAGMDVIGATVGQIAKIAAVDASGVPTAWSPADMPSGGSSDLYVDFWPTGSEQYNGNYNGYQIELATDQTFDAIFDSFNAGNKIVARLYKDADKSELSASSVDTAVTGSKEFGAIHFQFVTANADTGAIAGFPFIGEAIIMMKLGEAALIYLIENRNVLPTPNADGTDNGKVPIINGTKWELKTLPSYANGNEVSY